MILTFFISLYITIIAWSYGKLTLEGLGKINKGKFFLESSFIPTCFTGLATIGILFFFISIIIPVGSFVAQIILIIPPAVYLFKSGVNPWQKLTTRIKGTNLHFLAILLSGVYLLLILLMHAGTVNHPDTLNYHAQNIQFAEKYRPIPGIANLYLIYGLQSSWFVICAIFSFKFAGTTALTFINATVAIWFVFFLIQRINFYLQKKGSDMIVGLFWFALLVFSFWSYTQLRLFITSGSPDFIVALYLWFIFYLFISMEEQQLKYLLILLLSFFSVTIKLQALPVAFVALFWYYKFDNDILFRKVIKCSLLVLIIFIPLSVRNIISSGYLLFPSTFFDFFDFDWKAKKDFLLITQQYITAYARVNAPFSLDPASPEYHLDIREWAPIWWSLQSLPDKIILLSIPASFLSVILFHKKAFRNQSLRIWSVLLFLLLSVAFWFIKAPDPRFGFGFLIPFIALTLYLIRENITLNSTIIRKTTSFCMLLFSAGLFAYAGYRFSYYFQSKNIIQPAGIAPIAYKQALCNGIILNIPEKGNGCGDTPFPCLSIPCDSITLRGQSIERGFKLLK